MSTRHQRPRTNRRTEHQRTHRNTVTSREIRATSAQSRPRRTLSPRWTSSGGIIIFSSVGSLYRIYMQQLWSRSPGWSILRSSRSNLSFVQQAESFRKMLPLDRNYDDTLLRIAVSAPTPEVKQTIHITHKG